MNLIAVYFLEYAILTFCCDVVAKKIKLLNPDKAHEYTYANGYAILAFCYQIGVFISRSSLSFIIIRRVEIITLLQFANLIFWVFNTFFLFVQSYSVLFVIMILVGVMGGTSYVNVMYLILESDKLKKNQKELALTLSTAGNDFGILTASVLSLIIYNSVFANL